MPPSWMRAAPIWMWSASRIFGTPVTSAAQAAVGHSRTRQASQNFLNLIGIPKAESWSDRAIVLVNAAECQQPVRTTLSLLRVTLYRYTCEYVQHKIHW